MTTKKNKDVLDLIELIEKSPTIVAFLTDMLEAEGFVITSVPSATFVMGHTKSNPYPHTPFDAFKAWFNRTVGDELRRRKGFK